MTHLERSYLLCVTCLLLMACQDFSRFDCFREEEGCSPDPAADTQVGGQKWGFENLSEEEERSLIPNEPFTSTPPTQLCDEPPPPCHGCEEIDGSFSPNDDDSLCEPIDCQALDEYRLVEEGLCMRYSYRANQTSLCQEGRCLSDPLDFCVLSREIEQDIRTQLECQSLMGCQGEMPPQTEARVNNSCEQGQGVCDANGACVRSSEQRRFCGDLADFQACSTYSEQRRCTYSYDLLLGLGVLSFSDCNDLCSEIGAVCTSAWDEDQRNRCERRSMRTCGENGGRVICECQFPN